jgi:hypothetical protein
MRNTVHLWKTVPKMNTIKISIFCVQINPDLLPIFNSIIKILQTLRIKNN